MQTHTYLNFSGNCAEALKFYEQCLGAKIEALMSFGESPMGKQVPEEMRNKVLHARFRVGDTIMLASDAPPDRYEAPRGIAVAIIVKEPEDAERIFHALEEDGKVEMPIQKTFWSLRFGSLTDKFGIPWMVNCEQAVEAATGD